MDTSALNEVLQTILSYNLTTEEKQWIASRLCAETTSPNRPKTYEMNEEETADVLREDSPLLPYTMEEINAVIDESEQQIANGECYTQEEVHRMMDEFVRYQAIAV